MLIFDFDGVLMSSLNEVVLTVYNAATGGLQTSTAGLPQGPATLFRRNRFHVQHIGDGLTLMKWCLKAAAGQSDRILDPREYRLLVAGSAGDLAARTRLIYETRNIFIERDPERWFALHEPYQPLWNALTGQKIQPFVILTNKNRDATIRLCRFFGLEINSDEIYSGDESVSKVENMRSILMRFKAEGYVFIDDSIKNLQDIQTAFQGENPDLKLLFASWGYTGPEDMRIARASGYPVIGQEDAVRLLDQ
jgi:FMN phosphatase YigB (HAD superfamily)